MTMLNLIIEYPKNWDAPNQMFFIPLAVENSFQLSDIQYAKDMNGNDPRRPVHMHLIYEKIVPAIAGAKMLEIDSPRTFDLEFEDGIVIVGWFFSGRKNANAN